MVFLLDKPKPEPVPLQDAQAGLQEAAQATPQAEAVSQQAEATHIQEQCSAASSGLPGGEDKTDAYAFHRLLERQQSELSAEHMKVLTENAKLRGEKADLQERLRACDQFWSSCGSLRLSHACEARAVAAEAARDRAEPKVKVLRANNKRLEAELRSARPTATTPSNVMDEEEEEDEEVSSTPVDKIDRAKTTEDIPTVGDSDTESNHSGRRSTKGMTGSIIRDDKSNLSFEVKLGDGRLGGEVKDESNEDKACAVAGVEQTDQLPYKPLAKVTQSTPQIDDEGSDGCKELMECFDGAVQGLLDSTNLSESFVKDNREAKSGRAADCKQQNKIDASASKVEEHKLCHCDTHALWNAECVNSWEYVEAGMWSMEAEDGEEENREEGEEDEEEDDKMKNGAELPTTIEHTMEQAQRARHIVGTAVASVASSSAVHSAPPSATALSLVAAKEHLAEAAGVALLKAVKALDGAVDSCQTASVGDAAWIRRDAAVGFLEEARRLLQWEEPSTRPAAQAYDSVDDARKLENCPTDTSAVLKAAARATRDVLVLRCCWLVDHRSRDAFLHELALAFRRPIKGELESQLLHTYNTLTSSEHGYDVPDAFSSRNQLHRSRRPRKKKCPAIGEEVEAGAASSGRGGGGQGALRQAHEGFASSGGAASSGWRGGGQGDREFVEDLSQCCVESVLGAEDSDRLQAMEPMKVSVQGLESGEPGGLTEPPGPVPGFSGWNQGPYSAALGHHYHGHSSASSLSAAPGGLLGTGTPFGAASVADECAGASGAQGFRQRPTGHAQASGSSSAGRVGFNNGGTAGLHHVT